MADYSSRDNTYPGYSPPLSLAALVQQLPVAEHAACDLGHRINCIGPKDLRRGIHQRRRRNERHLEERWRNLMLRHGHEIHVKNTAVNTILNVIVDVNEQRRLFESKSW